MKSIEGDQLVLSGMQAGGYDLPALQKFNQADGSNALSLGTAFNVQTAIDSSNRIMVKELTNIFAFSRDFLINCINII